MEGMTSSGPNVVHDDELSESVDWVVVLLSSLCSFFLLFSARDGVVGLAGSCLSRESLSLIEAADAIIQDSPRTERSGVRGCPDMA